MGGEEPRDPIDFNGFSVEKGLSTGGSREQNCGLWAIVDFGKGPVEVRCTGTGEHDEHSCLVIFENEEFPEVDPTMN